MTALSLSAGHGALAFMLLHQPALALDVMEAIGAEKCAQGVRSYAIEFLAPENSTLEAKAKVMMAKASGSAATLSLDGKECTNGRCGFQAKKGETYRLVATARRSRPDELCIVVARP